MAVASGPVHVDRTNETKGTDNTVPVMRSNQWERCERTGRQ